jgi:hypothetical protein
MAAATFVENLYEAVAGSPQAKVAGIGYLILFLTVIATIAYRNITAKEEEPEKKMNALEITIVVLFLIVAYGLSVYSINCMVMGKCLIWAWINSVVVIVFTLLVVIASLF